MSISSLHRRLDKLQESLNVGQLTPAEQEIVNSAYARRMILPHYLRARLEKSNHLFPDDVIIKRWTHDLAEFRDYIDKNCEHTDPQPYFDAVAAVELNQKPKMNISIIELLTFGLEMEFIKQAMDLGCTFFLVFQHWTMKNYQPELKIK